jgi:hypothetical protein
MISKHILDFDMRQEKPNKLIRNFPAFDGV